MTTRLALLTGWLALSSMQPSFSQERPVHGYFHDGRGALRALVGVPGAFQSPVVVPEGVLSAGFDGQLLWYKTRDQLHLRWGDGREADLPAPPGEAAGRLEPETGTWLFRFKTTNEVFRIDPERLSLGLESAAEFGEAESPWIEQAGEGLTVERFEGGIGIRSSDGRFAVVPLAEVPSFQLLTVENGKEVPVGATFVMPPAAPGESSAARFRVRNSGAVAVVITRLSIDPGPFKTFDQFFPPRTIAPGDFADFWVRFSPEAPGEYTRTLYVNDLKVSLTGSSVGLAVVELETPAGWQVLKAGETVNLGSVERRSTLTRNIRITPPEVATVAGDGFQLVPGSDSSRFELRFVLDKPGLAKGALAVGQRVFPLEVTVTDFPVPTPSIELLDEPGPARQVRFRVKLSEAARTNLSAAVSVSFVPDAGLPDDAAVMLLPNSIRTVPVAITEGADASGEIIVQTGTTAGLIQLRAAIGTKAAQASFRIAPMRVALTAAKAAVASANAEVVLTGYDTARSASKIAFTFWLKSGQPASPGRIEADVQALFADYYKTISGSAFSLRAHFPVSGTHTELESVEIEIVNSAGATSTGRLRFE